MSIEYLLEGDPEEKITWQGHTTIGGRSVYGSRRSIAHLEVTHQTVERRYQSRLVVIQSAYNSGVSASAGTHDYDAVYDTYIPGIDWWEQQRFFREEGWAAWYRYPPSFTHHIHMVSLGYTTRVGENVPGQVSDYYNHKSGLSGHVADNTWHPENINATIFDYNEWKAKEGDDLPYSKAELKDIVKEAVREEASVYRENQRARYQAIREVLRTRFGLTDDKLNELDRELGPDE